MTVDIWQIAIPAVVGALTSGVPLYIKLRSALSDIRKQDAEAQIAIKAKESELQDKTKINTEGEWKRILEYRDAELVQLRTKDEQQEKKIDELFKLHVDCERDKARHEERFKAQNEKIVALEKKVEDANAPLAKNLALLVELLLEERKNVSKGTPVASLPAGSEIRVGPGS
jgi:hypothetical protein